MSKGAKDPNVEAHKASLRRSGRADYVGALRDGRKQRAATFTDRKREARRTACRGKVYA